MKEIKKQDAQGRQSYVPARVKVITTSVQRVICASDQPAGFGDYNNGGSY